MREYETVYIAHPNLTDAQVADMNDKAKSLVERNSGTFFFARNMGKRKLAYPIAKQTKGIYFCLDYAAGGTTVADLERMMRLDESILRFLTVMKTDEIDVEARRAEIAARGEDRSEITSAESEARPEVEVGEAAEASGSDMSDDEVERKRPPRRSKKAADTDE